MAAKKIVEQIEVIDAANNMKLISRKFDDGSRDLLEIPMERGNDHSHHMYDGDGKLTSTQGGKDYNTSGFNWQDVERQKLDESAAKSVEADSHRDKASRLLQEGRIQESEKELWRAKSAEIDAAKKLDEAKEVRAKMEAEQAKSHQKQPEHDRGR